MGINIPMGINSVKSRAVARALSMGNAQKGGAAQKEKA